MTLDELKEEVNSALKVNDERLDTEALKNQELYAKYLDHKSRFELLLHKAKGDYKKMYREKWEYYGGKADAKVYVTKPASNGLLILNKLHHYLNGLRCCMKSGYRYHTIIITNMAPIFYKMQTCKAFPGRNRPCLPPWFCHIAANSELMPLKN